MPIPVENNTSYGGNLVTQKYQPLAVNNAAIAPDTQAEYTRLFQGRINLLQTQNLFPSVLNLYTDNWRNLQRDEIAATSKPPIVVISSNRAEWIKKTWERAKEIQTENYANVNDVAALVAGPTPWYDPKRINDAGIHVYILVHSIEYTHYRTVLKGTGMKVVGWSFSTRRKKTCVGFGASRFAAIEFCKYIFNTRIARDAPDPPVPVARQKAWLVDDNVVYVNAFPGFNEVAAVMNDTIWGLGFSGATENSDDSKVQKQKNNTPAGLGKLLDKGLLQQCVLWNIGQLNANFLNFSPYFVSSNEDSSFSNFLQKQKISRIRFCKGATVVKGIPENGSGREGAQVSSLRASAQSNYYALECNYPVAPIKSTQGGVQSLGSYVAKHILPKANPVVKEENHTITEAKAVEQLMDQVITDRPSWVPAQTFRPNGNVAQVVQRFQNV